MAKRLQRAASAPRSASGPTGSPPIGSQSTARARRSGRSRRVAGAKVTEFTTQLATLSGAGIPVAKALMILEGQARPGPFKLVLSELLEDVSGGTPLSEALAKHPGAFDTLYASMVKAGEAGGVLDGVLLSIGKFREKAAAIRAKVVGAMIYPAIVALVALAVVSGVIVWIIPKFQDIFESFDAELPKTTRILLGFSSLVVQYWYLFFGLPLVCLLLHFFMLRRSEPYRYRVHKLLLGVPALGNVQSKSTIASFARTFGTLIESGVPHLDALEIVRETSSSAVLKRGVEEIRRTVREGEGIARPMGESGAFDDMVVNMVEVGEATGELDTMLLKVADAYEVAVDRSIDALFKVIEPALLIAMAVVVGFIVVALFMPLLSIMNQLGAQ